jgi:hypothetical protein
MLWAAADYPPFHVNFLRPRSPHGGTSQKCFSHYAVVAPTQALQHPVRSECACTICKRGRASVQLKQTQCCANQLQARILQNPSKRLVK